MAGRELTMFTSCGGSGDKTIEGFMHKTSETTPEPTETPKVTEKVPESFIEQMSHETTKVSSEDLISSVEDKLSSLINPAKKDETEKFSHDLDQTDAPTIFSLIVFLVLGFAIFYLLFVRNKN